jgi:DNA (cytosine-5)-methyltransferase 1
MTRTELKLIDDERTDDDYPGRIAATLLPSVSNDFPTVVDLFAGCGGLALGFESQGFETVGFEMDTNACATYNENLIGRCHQILLKPSTELPETRVVIGGPPCQPFSVGGRQLGLDDARNGFPVFVSAIERLRPEIWLFENVRGLYYRSRQYLDEVVDALRELGYEISARLLNAKSYGVPQNRERLIVVGHGGGFKWPHQVAEPPVTAGQALGELAGQSPEGAKFLTASMDAYVARYEKASKCINPRDLRLDSPARTITCRNIAGATGDMHRIRLADGRRRRITVREAARLQSFPDWFEFVGTETNQFNQIGNAVAPLFANHLAGSVRAYLEARTSPQHAARLASAV